MVKNTNKEIIYNKMNSGTKIALALSIVSSIPTVFFDIFRWLLLQKISQPLLSFLEIITFLLLVFTLMWTSIFFIIALIKRRPFFYSIMPFIISFIVYFVTTFNITGYIAQHINFYKEYENRMKVVKMIESGKLKVDLDKIRNDDLVELPSQYKYLSWNGKVYVRKKHGNTEIFFYVIINNALNYGGFLYEKNNKPPVEGLYYPIDITKKEKLSSHWYLVSE